MGEQVLVLRNVEGEDVCSINKTNDNFTMVMLKKDIDIVEPLSIYSEALGEIGTINIGEELLYTIANTIEKKLDKEALKQNKDINSFLHKTSVYFV